MTKENILKNKSKDELIDEILELREKLKEKESEINKLKWQLKIDSKTSSKPSSTNIFDKETPICTLKGHQDNSRKKWQNPRWGKKWHKWTNLKREDKVDKILDLTPCECKNCKLKFSKKFLKSLEKIKAFWTYLNNHWMVSFDRI